MEDNCTPNMYNEKYGYNVTVLNSVINTQANAI